MFVYIPNFFIIDIFLLILLQTAKEWRLLIQTLTF